MASGRTMGVVSYYAHDPFAPRGLRTRATLEAVRDGWSVELLTGPSKVPHPRGVGRVPSFLKYAAHRAAAVDIHEAWSKWHVRRWNPDMDVALVVAFPFSPAVEVVRRLAPSRVPVVIDTSDPWALTAVAPDLGTFALARARRAEAFMWAHASGAIFTTPRQEEAVRRRFPHLRTLVRPNGYQPLAVHPPAAATRQGGRELRIAHFGRLYFPRVAFGPFLRTLVDSGLWDSIVVEQFGDLLQQADRQFPPEIDLRIHEPVPWPRAVEMASEFDVALVVGNLDSAQLPSKVVEYLTLPIPRFAVVATPDNDAIADYVADKPGWAVVGADDPRAAHRLREHLAREWSVEELRAPASEAWPAVGAQIFQFATEFIPGD